MTQPEKNYTKKYSLSERDEETAADEDNFWKLQRITYFTAKIQIQISDLELGILHLVCMVSCFFICVPNFTLSLRFNPE